MNNFRFTAGIRRKWRCVFRMPTSDTMSKYRTMNVAEKMKDILFTLALPDLLK